MQPGKNFDYSRSVPAFSSEVAILSRSVVVSECYAFVYSTAVVEFSAGVLVSERAVLVSPGKPLIWEYFALDSIPAAVDSLRRVLEISSHGRRTARE